jgi:hypothetical protein
MSILLYVASAVVVMAGAAMIGFGVPINEFSFGNTLIIAGTTTMVGGLIIFGLGAAVAQLQRVADGLTARPLRHGEPFDELESQPADQLPFPPKHEEEHEPPSRVAEHAEPPKAPVELPPLPKLEEAPAARPELPAFPFRRRPAPPPAPPPPPFGGPSAPETHEEPASTRWRRPPPPPPPPPPEPPKSPNFEDMWPVREMALPPKPFFAAEPEAELKAEPAVPEPPVHEPPPPPMREPPPVREMMPPPRREPPSLRETVPPPLREVPPPAPEPEIAPAGEAPRAIAILKSGVVDGMGYTLYVDGSIEAELPQGTLRFTSINELREHLEKSS